jgi:hypothetical protein
MSIELKPISNNESRANSYLKFSYINIAIGIGLVLHSLYVRSKSIEINKNIKQNGLYYTIAKNDWLSANTNLSLFLTIMTFVTFIIFVSWSYRAYKNLHINSDYVSYNPSWAIWGYIVPVLNFVRPQQVMTDLVKRNTKLIQSIEPEYNKKYPLIWISVWWLFYIAYYITDNFAISFTNDTFINFTTVDDLTAVNTIKGLVFLFMVFIQIKMVQYVKGIETHIYKLTEEDDEIDTNENDPETEE